MFFFCQSSVNQKVSRLLKWSLSYMLQTPSSPPAQRLLSHALPLLFLPSILICVAFANLDVPLVGPAKFKVCLELQENREALRHTATFHPVPSLCVWGVCVVSLYF